MFNLFKKSRLSALLALLLLNTMNSSLVAWEDCEAPQCNRFYVGGFGGELYSNSTRISQMGTAFFTEAEGGPLAVFARGKAKKRSSGFGGAQIGYEWGKCVQCGCSDFAIASGVELEGLWYNHKKSGHLINDAVGRLDEHDFLDSFHINSGVYLANAIFSLKSNSLWGFTPYVGAGVGATHISISKADSLQTSPPEAGVNHFNSRRSDSSWAFAAQAKAGIRYNICNSFHIFGEYRYLFVDSSNYIFGSTSYANPPHPVTSPWNVKINNIHYNAFAVGIQFDL